MALNVCCVIGCKREKPNKFLMCGEHWGRLGKDLQYRVRQGTEKGKHTLRAVPQDLWWSKVQEIVGQCRISVRAAVVKPKKKGPQQQQAQGNAAAAAA